MAMQQLTLILTQAMIWSFPDSWFQPLKVSKKVSW